MHTIKFRGKILNGTRKGEWVYGYYIQGANNKHFIAKSLNVDVIEVDPKTVGQYMGLKDTMNTVSIEVAKELFELGWKRAGIFVYDNEEKIEHQQGVSYFKGEYALKELRDIKRMHKDVIPASQLHEILDVLPDMINSKNRNFFLKLDKIEVDYTIGYYEFQEDALVKNESKNPHDAAAALLIWCVKNNYVTLTIKKVVDQLCNGCDRVTCECGKTAYEEYSGFDRVA